MGKKDAVFSVEETHRKRKTDGQICNILFLVGVNALPALCVDVGERREKPLNCVYVLVHAVGETRSMRTSTGPHLVLSGLCGIQCV